MFGNTDFPIVGQTRNRQHDSPTHGESTIEVEVTEFYPRTESWTFTPGGTREAFPGHVYDYALSYNGLENFRCHITLTTEDGDTLHQGASIARNVHGDMEVSTPGVTYSSSCMVRSKTGVSIGRTRENRLRRHRDDYDMFWDFSAGGELSREDLLDLLVDEAWRLFEPDVPNDIRH